MDELRSISIGVPIASGDAARAYNARPFERAVAYGSIHLIALRNGTRGHGSGGAGFWRRSRVS